MVHLGHRQITEVITTQSPPNRSGHMLMVKTTVHSGYASYARGTETAEVESLWPSKDPNTCPKHPDNSNSSS